MIRVSPGHWYCWRAPRWFYWASKRHHHRRSVGPGISSVRTLSTWTGAAVGCVSVPPLLFPPTSTCACEETLPRGSLSLLTSFPWLKKPGLGIRKSGFYPTEVLHECAGSHKEIKTFGFNTCKTLCWGLNAYPGFDVSHLLTFLDQAL